jgi:predicted nucleic acid-binding protein
VNYLLDTNVISELRKGPRGSASVAAWFASLRDEQAFLSVLVLGEIRRGIEMARSKEPDRALLFAEWLESLRRKFADRVLVVDQAVADEWGRMIATQATHVTDVLLAATAKVNGMTLATRKVRHVAGLGVEIVNPFDLPR